MEAPSRLSGERYTGEAGKWRRPPGCQRASKMWMCEVKCEHECPSVPCASEWTVRQAARNRERRIRCSGGARHVCMVVVCCACKQLVAAQSSMCRSVARERRLVPLRIWTRRDSHPAARAAVRHVEWRDVLICNMLARTHRARMRDTEQSVGVRGKRRRWEALR